MELRCMLYCTAFTLAFFIAYPTQTASILDSHVFHHQKVSCPRFLALQQTCDSFLPLPLIALVRVYDGFNLKQSIQLKGYIAACALMKNNRMVLADNAGKISILDYVTQKIIQEVETHQKGIEQLEYVSFSQNSEEERIVSIAPLTNNVKILDGSGKTLHSRISNYICHPFLFKLAMFDAFTLFSTLPTEPLDRVILKGFGNPFRVQRIVCKHALYMPGGIILGCRSGKLEYRHYCMNSSTMRWVNKPLKEVNKSEKPNPVTALALLNNESFFAGFADGTVELRDLSGDLKKVWQAHTDIVKNISIFNKDNVITTSGKALYMWRLPSFEKEATEIFPSDILKVLTTNNECSNNYVIVAFAQDPLQIWTC